ncbi:hypothetical protein [Rhodococcus koreensis]
MLKWPDSERIKGITVHRDDTDPNMYYLLPSTPRFRLDAEGNPVFRFLKYKFPVNRPDGKVGGGFLVCDAEFGVNEQEEEAVKKELEQRTGQPVKIGRLSFLRGEANVSVLDNGGALVQKVTNPGSPSLYGQMVLPITIELSPEGATLLESALQEKGGIVQVTYDIWTPVKLPPVQAHVYFHAEKVFEFNQDIDVDEKFCGSADRYTETIKETIRQRDVGNVDILPGTVTDPNVLKAVEDWGWKTLTDATTRMVLGDIPMQNQEDIRKLYLEQDFEHVTVDIQKSRFVDFDRWYTKNMVMEWNPAPRGTLPNITSMKGPNGQTYKWEDFSTVIDLDDPFFRTMTVKARVNADFEELPLHSVEVKIEYDKGGGQLVVDEFLLDKTDSIGTFKTFVANNNLNYTYTYQVNYDGEATPFVSEPTVTNDPSLVINVGDTGIIHLDIVPGDLNFDQVKQAQVSLWYQGGDLPRMEHSLTLDKENQKHNWKKVIFQKQREPVHYLVKYFMADGREFLGKEQTIGSGQLRINDPFSSLRTVKVVGSGDFENRIEMIFVDLKYIDEENDFMQTESFALNAEEKWSQWIFPAILQDGGKLTYSGNIRFKDGTVQTIPLTPVEGSTLIIGDVLLAQPIEVRADLVDWTAAKLVKVSLHHEEAGVNETEDFVFKESNASTAQVWKMPYKVTANKAYSWKAQYFKADGSSKTTGADNVTDEMLVLPATAV